MPDFVRDQKPVVPAVLTTSAVQVPAWSEVTRLVEARGIAREQNVEQATQDTFRVRLGGSFGQGWLASLCRGLAVQSISIERAHAMRMRNLSWIAEFTARALAGAPQPESVPYLALAASPVPPDEQPLALDRYELEACYDGTLKLAFEAQDTLGLLGALLEKLAALGLYPVEMHIETHTQRALDMLWLSTADGGAPGDLVRAALERVLRTSLRHARR